jgi:transcriptional regulator with XRE-family HTH domain
MKPDSQADIRAAFRRRRERLGLRQEDMADAIGVARLVYARIEGAPRRKIITPALAETIDLVLRRYEAKRWAQMAFDIGEHGKSESKP